MKNFNPNGISFTNDGLQTDLELIKRALDSSISGIIITDNQQPDNPIIYCNKAFENMTGYGHSEIIGHNCRFLQAKDKGQESIDVLRKAIKKGEPCMVEIRNYKKNGDLFWNELYLSTVKNSEGKISHFIGVQNDVSKRKQTDLDLIQHQETMEKKIVERTNSIKESEEYLASIIQTVKQSLVVLDKNMQILSVNKHFLQTFKVSANESEGKSFYELGNGQWNIPHLKEMLEKILPTNSQIEDLVVEHDFLHIGKKFMLINGYRIKLEGNYKDRILLVIEDVTDRMELERRKDDFLSIASHELKTPLTTVKGYMQMIQRMIPENSSDKFKSIVGKTVFYLGRLNNLINELLDVSKIQTGKLEIYRNEFDFDKMIAETVEGMQMARLNCQITVEGATKAMLSGDESHIIQVVNNLLSNGLKYSPDNDHVLIQLSRVSTFVKVSVIDNGIGISQDDQKKIFDRFFRVGEVQKIFPGMGVGLYVCAEIIKNHGGSLWVESEKGKGSNFSFTLPIEGL
ncbi:PAS domain-containing protein [Pedobacter sp. UYP30]|uniref:PAS domain-containing sensor histidine kinase n=1 Tax=Pedobacter sp. UYP30 TaxID=1756400 RepID=UPI00339323D5